MANFKQFKKFRLAVIILLLILIPVDMNTKTSFNYSKDKTDSTSSDFSSTIKISASFNYTDTQFWITDNGEWSILAAYYDWCSGSGTINDPYIIEDVYFRMDIFRLSALKIENTNVHFVIQNCEFEGFGMHIIHFFNTANGEIKNCKFEDSAIGMHRGYNIKINNNEISGFGIYSNGSTNLDISDNTITGNSIHLSADTNNSKISNNHIIMPLDNGIALTYGANDNLVENNSVEYAGAAGIALSFGSHNNEVRGNIVEGSEANGINVRENCYENTFINNVVNNNERYGIELASSDNNVIRENTFTGNLKGCVAEHECTGNTIEQFCLFPFDVYYMHFIIGIVSFVIGIVIGILIGKRWKKKRS